MKILLIDNPSSFLDFALRCMEHGHQVKTWMGSDKRGARSTVGDGMIDKIPDWRTAMKWADLIVTSDNVIHMRELEAYRKAGFPIFNAHAAVTDWELNRGTGQRVFEAAGIPTIDSPVFTSYDKAIAFVEKTMKRYVSKPSGDADKALTYVSKGPRDMISMLERWKKLNKLKAPFILQEFKPGIEMAVSGWFGPNGFSKYFLENFEFKKLMNDDKGPACFTPDAEVLTKGGWKLWPDVTMEDEICTLKDGEIQYERPSQLIAADFDGNLVGWKGKRCDILVTPGHNMYVQDDHYRKEFFFEPAEESFFKRRTIMRAGGAWKGELHHSAEFAALVGAYIADGNCHRGSIVFGNCPAHKQSEFIEIAKAAGYRAKMYGKDLYINSVDLVAQLRPLGRAADKFVPQWVKDASVNVIESFLRGYGAGDGSRRETNLTYTTVSKRLADDLQELALKVNWAAIVGIRDRVGESHMINGIECVSRRVAYEVYVSKEKVKAEISEDNRYLEQYAGTVYCCTVSSHVIYVRRNGKACWIGQTGEQGTLMRYVTESKLADLVLKPLAPELFRQGYCGFIDVSVMIDEKGQPWPMEHTCTRFGWPLFQIQQELHPDPVTWMYDLLYGFDSFEPDTKIAAGVVVAIPDYPYSHLTKKEVSDFPIWGITDQNRAHVHFAEVKLGMGVEEDGGKIVRRKMPVTAGDYVYIATGKAGTVEAAAKAAYRVVDQVELPNSPILRTDIGNRLEKQLPKLQKNGFALGWKYR